MINFITSITYTDIILGLTLTIVSVGFSWTFAALSQYQIKRL